MFERTLFTEEHTLFRDAARRFMETEVQPHRERWEEQGYVDREVWLKAGAAGFLCPSMPEQYGGAGADKRYSTVLIEEQYRIGDSGLGFSLHSEIVAPYLLHYGSEHIKQTYLPKMASGDFSPTGHLRTIMKDLDMVLDLARATRTPMPMTAKEGPASSP